MSVDFLVGTICSYLVVPKAIGASIATSTNSNTATTGRHVRSFLRLALVKSNYLSDFFGRPSLAICLTTFLLPHIWAIPF